MSQKNRIIRPVVPNAKTKKGVATKIKDIDLELLKDSNEEQSVEEKPKMKRLKKIKNQQSSQDEEYIEEREDLKESSGEEGDNEKFQKFHIADDDDIKRQDEEKKLKKNKKMKGLQSLDKFMGATSDKPKQKKVIKAPKKQPQSLSVLFQSSKYKKPQKDGFDMMMQKMDCSENEGEQIDEIQQKRRTILAYRSLDNNSSEFNSFQAQRQERALKIQRQQIEELKKNLRQNQMISQTEQNVDGSPFYKKEFTLTGEFEDFSSTQFMSALQKMGAVCSKTLSKNTHYLIQGSFAKNKWKRKIDVKQTNQSKEAEKRGIQTIRYDDIETFLMTNVGKNINEFLGRQQKQRQMDEEPKLVEIQNIIKEQEMMNMDIDIESQKGTLPKKKNIYEQVTVPQEKQRIIVEKYVPSIIHKQPIVKKAEKVQIDNVPWSQKYKPKSMNEIVGQISQIKNLKEWIEAWEDIQIRGNKREIKGGSYNSFKPAGNINSKAALISGDAGLGKTTTARLLAQQYGYKVVQFNASDIRNKKSIDLLQNKNNYTLSASKRPSKTLLVMDQIDGMSSGDRGGISAIINFIKKTKVPIICICNDRDCQKIRSLAGHCYDIKFFKPDRNLIIKRLSKIIQLQGGTFNEKGLQKIIQLLQNDIRQILTYLQIFFKTVSNNVSYNTVEKYSAQSKDLSLMMNHFEATKKLMNRPIFKPMKIQERIDLGFVDSDLVPLMCQENYLSSCQKNMKLSDFRNLVSASDSLVAGDMINKKIRKNQQFTLMPNQMFLECVYPAEKVSFNLGHVKFTSWLGKFSSQRKTKRLIKELTHSLETKIQTTFSTTKYQYSPLLFNEIVRKLKENEPTQDIIRFMESYNLTPGNITQHLEGTQFGDCQKNLKEIPAQTKSKLTKAFNKIHQTENFKKEKIKNTEQMIKYDPVLQEFQNLKLDDDSQQEENVEKVVVEKNSKGIKKNTKKKK